MNNPHDLPKASWHNFVCPLTFNINLNPGTRQKPGLRCSLRVQVNKDTKSIISRFDFQIDFKIDYLFTLFNVIIICSELKIISKIHVFRTEQSNVLWIFIKDQLAQKIFSLIYEIESSHTSKTRLHSFPKSADEQKYYMYHFKIWFSDLIFISIIFYITQWINYYHHIW